MRIILHTDDAGITRQACAHVVDTWRAGALTGFSVIANGDGAAELTCQLERSRELPARIGVHLNLTEGPSSAPAEAVPLLVDSQGRFRHEFGGLLKLALARRYVRTSLAAQVAAECVAQIRAVKTICGNRPVTVIDGHNHVQMIPGIFGVVAAVARDEGLTEIRVSQESFYLARLTDLLCPWLWINLVKYGLLRLLSRLAKPVAEAAGLASPTRMVGILYTGRMTQDTALRGIAAAEREGATTVEVAFHVGRAASDEAGRWGRAGASYARFHLSSLRDHERAELLRLAKHPLGRGGLTT